MSQPMQNSGVPIDPITGQPINPGLSFDREVLQAKERLIRLQLQAQNLRAELTQSQGEVIRALEAEMLARAEEVLSRDPEYQALQRFAQRLGTQLNVLPALVRRSIKRLVGEEEIIRWTEGNEAAPDNRDTGQ